MVIQSNAPKSLDCEYRAMNLKQAGRHLLRLAKGNSGPQDHVRVAELCLAADSLVEVERAARLRKEFSVDVDDALQSIQRLMDGRWFPLSSGQALEIDSEAETTASIDRPRC